MKYRKRPEIIQAMQYDGNNSADICEFVGSCFQILLGDERFEIYTLEGMMIARPGDYIIKDVKGKFYPCKPDVFERTYEKVND